jgi:hypothetical protein
MVIIERGLPERLVPDWLTLFVSPDRSVTARPYQRNNLGPISAPSDAASRMPSEYQVNTKSAETSPQCRQ